MSLPEIAFKHYEAIDFFSIIGDAGPNCKCDFCGKKFSMADFDGIEEHLQKNHFKEVTKVEAEFQ